MASFPLKFLPPVFNPQFKNVPLALDGWNFAHPSLTCMANYPCKFSPAIYPLPIMDGRTDDNYANISIGKYGGLKRICGVMNCKKTDVSSNNTYWSPYL